MKAALYAAALILFAAAAPGAGAQPPHPDAIDVARAGSWNDLESGVADPQVRADLAALKSATSFADARFVLEQLAALKNPARIRELSTRADARAAHGGGFFGMIPDPFADPDSIPVPRDAASQVRAALFLARARAANLAAIAAVSADYPLAFGDRPFPAAPPGPGPRPARMALALDVSPIARLLDMMAQPAVAPAAIDSLASCHAFSEMLAHRRSLGYVPPPLPDASDLAWFISHGVSHDPIDRLWAWTNPWNDFCIADLAQHADRYRALIDTLRTREPQIVDRVLGRIGEFVPADTEFSDRVVFAVDWGIRSWATADALGTNIVQFKDDWDLMLRTITHETFHRVQLRVCPLDPGRDRSRPPEFEDLTRRPFATTADSLLYEALSYAMLEGTATLVGGAPDGWSDGAAARAGWDLLRRDVAAIENGDRDEAATLLNRGLKSNGPFYALGWSVARDLRDRLGRDTFRKTPAAGAIEFFARYLEADPTAGGDVDASFGEALHRRLVSMR